MQNPTDRPIPESLAREIAADAAMLANQVRLMNLVTAVVNPETMFSDKPVTTADLGAMANELQTHYAGGPDGPIREPGDDMPSFGDVYGSPEEFAQLLDKHSDRLVRLGMYDVAGDLSVAAQKISEQAEQIEVARDKVKELVDEIAALSYEIRRRNGGF